uniref:Protein YIPF n=1 Tax=Hyaloperonospora arabidopsidis (strain Emoy2) TaxID=559515 RepID=M4B9D4_HYAAE
MNMNMDPNGMSPWFTTQDGTYPPVNAQTQLPNNGGAGSDFTAPIPGSSGLGGTVGSSSGFYDDGDDENEFAHEPPLLEVLSCLFMYMLMNLLSPERTIDIYRVCSVLGYCLLPIIGLAAINIVVSVKDLGIAGFVVASVCTLWSTHTASRFFEKALYMTEQKYLVMYPTMLVYACFVLIAVF